MQNRNRVKNFYQSKFSLKKNLYQQILSKINFHRKKNFFDKKKLQKKIFFMKKKFLFKKKLYKKNNRTGLFTLSKNSALNILVEILKRSIEEQGSAFPEQFSKLFK